MACQEPADLPDAGGDASAGGYMEPCSGPGDCDAYEADYCLFDPSSDDPGICLYQDCDVDSCPAESVCCDCSNLMMPVICLPEAILGGTALDTCNCNL